MRIEVARTELQKAVQEMRWRWRIPNGEVYKNDTGALFEIGDGTLSITSLALRTISWVTLYGNSEGQATCFVPRWELEEKAVQITDPLGDSLMGLEVDEQNVTLHTNLGDVVLKGKQTPSKWIDVVESEYVLTDTGVEDINVSALGVKGIGRRRGMAKVQVSQRRADEFKMIVLPGKPEHRMLIMDLAKRYQQEPLFTYG